MKAGCWALENDVSVVVANGLCKDVILEIVRGRKIGTFFTKGKPTGTSPEQQATNGNNTLCLVLSDFPLGLLWFSLLVKSYDRVSVVETALATV